MKKIKEHANKSLKCGMCHWYWEDDCKHTRKVKKNSQACVEFDKVKFNPRIIRKMDSFVKDLLKRLENDSFIVDLSIVDELNMYYVFAKYDEVKKKIVRNVTTSLDKNSIKKLISLLEETQANKDRVTEIKITFLGLASKLNAFKETCESYMYDHYMNDLSSLKNENLRLITMKSIFRELFEKIDLVSYVLNVVETTDKNLTNSYFSLREISQLAIAFSKKE